MHHSEKNFWRGEKRKRRKFFSLGCKTYHRQPTQTVQKLLHLHWISNGCSWLNLQYHQNCFCFWQIVSKKQNKNYKINHAFWLVCVNCVISFHFDGFWDGFIVHSSSDLCYCIKMKRQATSFTCWTESPTENV